MLFRRRKANPFQDAATLEWYTKIVEWHDGCLVVLAKYNDEPAEEEYSDLVPILENLYINPREFCRSIDEVRIT